MYKFYRGQKFGNWEVINPKREYIQGPKIKLPYILCFDSIYNELRYVRVNSLVNGTSKGSKIGSKGWSTRYKFKSLPKYVYLFQSKNLNSKCPMFRVMKKDKGKVITYGYFYNLTEAKNQAEAMNV